MSTEVHDPGNTKPLTELYVFVSVDSNGNEGILGAPLPGIQGTMPLVAMSKQLAMNVLRPIAKEMGERSGKKVKLLKLTNREDIEEM